MKKQPIGVFDSGLGGLTILKALRRTLPQEDLIYFGDTANVPYGSKSKEAVTRFSTAIAQFLQTQQVKMIVVACNTASALALPTLRKICKVPVLGVILPGAQKAAAITRNGRVAILGTEATVRSKAYPKALLKINPRLHTFQQPCPLFVPIVEENLSRTPLAQAAVQLYLTPVLRAKADTVILGCTHYPVLKKLLAQALGPKAQLVDSADTLAQTVCEFLHRHRLCATQGKGKLTVYASDDPTRFKRLAVRILGKPIGKVRLQKLNV